MTNQIPTEMELKAKTELGEDEYNSKLSTVFGKQVLNFANTLVINLPGSCYADCDYCIDKKLRPNACDVHTFFESLDRITKEPFNFERISITGGSLDAKHFNQIISIITKRWPDAIITWNTNGIFITDEYNIAPIIHINLHRNAIRESSNKILFRTFAIPMTIDDARKMFGTKLSLRVTVDESFELDDWAKLGVPLYLNRMLPETPATKHKFEDIIRKCQADNKEVRRRNVYLNTTYKDIPVRLCCGDKQAECVINRYPTYLNVVILHRSGIISGSWFENDKLLFDPSETNIVNKKYVIQIEFDDKKLIKAANADALSWLLTCKVAFTDNNGSYSRQMDFSKIAKIQEATEDDIRILRRFHILDNISEGICIKDKNKIFKPESDDWENFNKNILS